MTAAYLIFELGFNARLLDVAGSLASPEEVTSIEKWGRLISGLAITLFIWGTVILPRAWTHRWSRLALLRTLIISATCLMSLTYFGKKWLVDDIVNNASNHTKHEAVELRLVINAILHGRASVTGIDLSSTLLSSPEGKSFLVMMPIQALSIPDLLDRLDKPLSTMVAAEVRSTIGPADAMFHGPFQASSQQVEAQWQAYHNAQTTLKAIPTDPESWVFQMLPVRWDRYRSCQYGTRLP